MDDRRNENGLISFASRTVTRHIVRGVIGLSLLIAAFALIPLVGALSLLLALPAVVALRGCPTCWLLGLSETLANRRPCPDGACH